MPIATGQQVRKNIWVAAGEGDIDRVKELIENEAFSPNAPDPYTYTPMHAAASYGCIHVLEYLVSKGGNVNVKDSDDETPLFTVESVDVARWLIEHGAQPDCLNQEGNTSSQPAQHLAEEFPLVSAYLTSLDTNSLVPTSTSRPMLSTYHTDQVASQLTQSILTDAQAIIQHAEAEGRDPEAALREMVGRAVLGGVVAASAWSQDSMTDGGGNDEHGRGGGEHDSQPTSKRSRLDEAGR